MDNESLRTHCEVSPFHSWCLYGRSFYDPVVPTALASMGIRIQESAELYGKVGAPMHVHVALHLIS